MRRGRSGDLLIIAEQVSVAGRAFEVTGEDEIVWEFINPDLSGENDELIATLLEMTRVPDDFPRSRAARP
jgi:hypothetical protein